MLNYQRVPQKNDGTKRWENDTISLKNPGIQWLISILPWFCHDFTMTFLPNLMARWPKKHPALLSPKGCGVYSFDCWRHSSPVRVPETISGISRGYHGIYNVYVYIYIYLYNGGTPLAGWSIYVYLLEKNGWSLGYLHGLETSIDVVWKWTHLSIGF